MRERERESENEREIEREREREREIEREREKERERESERVRVQLSESGSGSERTTNETMWSLIKGYLPLEGTSPGSLRRGLWSLQSKSAAVSPVIPTAEP